MHSKQQQAVLSYIQQAVYSSSKQCRKQYAEVAASSLASSSSIAAAAQAALLTPTANTSTPHNYYCTRTRMQFFRSSSIAALLYTAVYGVRQAAADKASSCSNTTAVAVSCCKVCIIWHVPGTCTSVRAHAQQYTESLLLVYPLHAATLL